MSETQTQALFDSWRFPARDLPAADRAERRQQTLTKPRKSLGRLEAVPVQLAALQGTELPTVRPAAAILFAADSPVCRHGVSAYPSEVTAAMVTNFVAGGAAASVCARALDLPLHVVDVGVAHPYVQGEGTAATVVRDPIADEPEGDLRVEDALADHTFARAIQAGADAVDRLAFDARVLLLGEMGIGNTTIASAMACALLEISPEAVVGPGAGLANDQLPNKRAVVRDACARSFERSPVAVLRTLGGRQAAALVGAAARACERGMSVVVDGFIVSTALLALVRERPEVRSHLLFAHRSAEPGHDAVLRAFEAEPVLDLSMALGEASGALLAFPLIELACTLHREMATFDEAQVPDKER